MKAGFKQTEVGVIPEDWEVKPFGLIANIERGKFSARPRNDPKYYGGDIPFLQTGDIAKDHGIIRSFSQTLNDNGLKVSKVFPCGTLFFTIAANIGDVGVATFDAACPDSIVGIRTKQGTEIRWLAYQLATKKGCFEQIATTTTQLNINLEKLRPYLLAIPPYSEQRSIAEALGDADALIESLERLVAKKRDVKQGAMQELLTARRRLPGVTGEWETKRLGEICDICKGELITEKNCIPGEIPVIAGGRQPAYFHKSANRRGKTITVSASGASAGYVALYTAPIYASDCSTISECDSYSLEFVYYALLLNQNTIYNAQSGGAQPHIHPDDLVPLVIAVPNTKDEQTAIAAVLSDMDAELAALEAKLAKARAIKQGMMQELLTGRIRLK